MSKNIVKATKSKKIAYRCEKASNDKNLLLANSEILVMRVQNEPKLKFFAIFSQLSTETSLQEISSDETFVIKDMQFLPDAEQFSIKLGEGKTSPNNHKNILAIIDNQNRVYLMEIVVDYENGKMLCILFADMPSKEQEECLQIFWSGEHLMILKEGSLIMDRKLKLKNNSIMQKQQYLVGTKEVVSKRIVSGKNQSNRMLFYGISGNANSVFLNDKDNQSLFFAISLTNNSDLLDIYLSAYNDLIVTTRSGTLFALGTEKLDIIQVYQTKLEDDEYVIEAHMDNTLTSVFLLTNKNQIYHIFIQKSKLRDGSVQVFKSRGQLRFHTKNVIFTFRVLSMPESLEQYIFKQNENNFQISSSFINFKPNISNVKYMLYSLLASEEVMKIFSVDLTTHETIFQDSDIEFEYPFFYFDSNDQPSNNLIASSSNLATSNKPSVTSLPQISDQIPNFDQLTTQKPDTQTAPQQQKQVKISENTGTGSQNSLQQNRYGEEQQQYSQNSQDRSFHQKSSFAQENEHKSSSKPVNPSILPSPQDPILGMQYYQFEQQQQQQQQQQVQYQQILHVVQSKDYASHASHEQKEVKKKNQIRTLTNQNDNPQPGDDHQDIHTHYHHQHPDHRNYLDDVKDNKINQIFQDNIERITTKLDDYFEKKFNKLDANIGAKIEKIRKDDDIVGLVDKSTAQQREKLEFFLKDEMESQYKNYVEQNMKTYMIDMFQQVTKNFERGQKFYTDKIQQEKEKCKIQNENSDEIMNIVKKITGPFSESTIIHKKILTDIVQLSNERKNKMDNLEKQLSQLINKQDQIVNRIVDLEKKLQDEMATQKIQKLVEQSVLNQFQKSQQFSTGVQFRPENVTIQYPNMKKQNQQGDINSANESGGDNSRKRQQFKKKIIVQNQQS